MFKQTLYTIGVLIVIGIVVYIVVAPILALMQH